MPKAAPTPLWLCRRCANADKPKRRRVPKGLAAALQRACPPLAHRAPSYRDPKGPFVRPTGPLSRPEGPPALSRGRQPPVDCHLAHSPEGATAIDLLAKCDVRCRPFGALFVTSTFRGLAPPAKRCRPSGLGSAELAGSPPVNGPSRAPLGRLVVATGGALRSPWKRASHSPEPLGRLTPPDQDMLPLGIRGAVVTCLDKGTEGKGVALSADESTMICAPAPLGAWG